MTRDWAYPWTAEPVGVCSCHDCTCPGCPRCEDEPEYEWSEVEPPEERTDPWEVETDVVPRG